MFRTLLSIAISLAAGVINLAQAALFDGFTEPNRKIDVAATESGTVAKLLGRIDSLTIRAPSAGRVIARDIDAPVGRYLAEGSEIAMLGREDAKEHCTSSSQRASVLPGRPAAGVGCCRACEAHQSSRLWCRVREAHRSFRSVGWCRACEGHQSEATDRSTFAIRW